MWRFSCALISSYVADAMVGTDIAKRASATIAASGEMSIQDTSQELAHSQGEWWSPSCTTGDGDPYRSGSHVACCEGLDQVLVGSAYKCQAAAVPAAACTRQDEDPDGTGALVACCYGLHPVLEGSGYKCRAIGDPGDGAQDSGYDENKAVDFVWINQAMDCDAGCIGRWGCANCGRVSGVRDVQVVEGQSTQTLAMVAHWNDDCLVAFRGTKNQRNWDLNAKAIWSFYGCFGCMVHGGYQEIWRDLKPGLMRALEQKGCSNKKVQVTGHSMGGAIASIASYDMVNEGFTVENLYTFGEAPTGNSRWASSRESLWNTKGVNYFRVTHYKDEVPLMARSKTQMWMRAIINYVHAGPEVYYYSTQRGNFKVCEDGNDVECSLQWCTWTSCDAGLGRHGACDHCSYLGLDPCTTGATGPKCVAP